MLTFPMFDGQSDFFEILSIRHLIGQHNTCHGDWKDINVRYLFHKFYYFTGGEGYIKIKDELFRPRQGDLYFIPAGTMHSHWQNPENPVIQYWSHFEADLPEDRHFRYHRDGLFCRPDREKTESVFSLILEDESELFYPLNSRLALLELLKLFLEKIDPALILRYDKTSLINRINEYIAVNIEEDIRLADLAELAHQHPNYFVAHFKKHYGTTPIDYVNSFRLQRANKILNEDKELTISAAAAMVGFKDYRYFTRLYKRKYGMTPSRLRRTHLGEKG